MFAESTVILKGKNQIDTKFFHINARSQMMEEWYFQSARGKELISRNIILFCSKFRLQMMP